LIPYFQQPSLHLFGPDTIHAFGFLVAMAVIVGSKLAIMRCELRFSCSTADRGRPAFT
jgi:hypothetical protein